MNARPPSPATLKAASNRTHARNRAAERHGVDLTPSLCSAWEADIRNGVARTLSTEYGGRHRHLCAVEHEGRLIPVVYDAATKSLVTVLPPHALDRFRPAIEASPRPVPPPDPVAVPPAAADPDPGLTDDSDLAEFDRAIWGLTEKIAGLMGELAARGVGARPHPVVTADLAMAALARRDLKRRRHARYCRAQAVEFGGDPDDPYQVLLALYRAYHAVCGRFGPENLSESEHAARKAAAYCLSKRGLADPSHHC